MKNVVFDTSALLAVINGEAGGDQVSELLSDDGTHSLVSAVNLSEAQAVLIHQGMPDSDAWSLLSSFDLEVVPFDAEQARAAGVLIARTSEFSLSFGDRACLALGLHERCKVVTADCAWKKLSLGVEVELVRGEVTKIPLLLRGLLDRARRVHDCRLSRCGDSRHGCRPHDRAGEGFSNIEVGTPLSGAVGLGPAVLTTHKPNAAKMIVSTEEMSVMGETLPAKRCQKPTLV